MSDYYKVLSANRMPRNGGKGQWHPNAWMPPVKGDIVPCSNGYHLCRREDLVHWLGPEIWVAKGRGDQVEDDDKIVFREARLVKRLDTWNDRTARLFGADCAERVLHFYEQHSDDKAPANAIRAARDFANGRITADKLATAWDASATARDTAWATARDASAAAWAASAAARDASAAAWAARAAAWAASAAAWAARAAAWAARATAWAARATARDAERKWQTDRLFHYLEGGQP